MQKTIFITGASSGLGKATAKLFQAEDWYVIATMRNPAAESELSALENVTILPLDVTDPRQILSTVMQATAIRKIDVVFNNAGYGLMGALEALSDEQISKQINTNLLGVIRVTQAFIPHFREHLGGLIINTTSMGGLFGFPLHSIYHATKFGVEGWAESMSFELSPHNIGIKTIAPGGFANHDLLTKMENLLNAHFEDLAPLKNELPTVEYLADQLHLSPHYLSDMLRSLTGQSAQQHIHEKLIEKAKQYLSTTNLSVAEIAYQLGFEYAQSFNKLFKKKMNVSPLEFRRSYN